jgi:hypothetical protein
MAFIYTSRVDLCFQRNDVFDWNGKEYHVVGVQTGLNLNTYQQLTGAYYPEVAQKRINRQEYPV